MNFDRIENFTHVSFGILGNGRTLEGIFLTEELEETSPCYGAVRHREVSRRDHCLTRSHQHRQGPSSDLIFKRASLVCTPKIAAPDALPLAVCAPLSTEADVGEAASGWSVSESDSYARLTMSCSWTLPYVKSDSN